ncbi:MULTISPECIES: acyl-CoA dehydrogenase family protein [unclassified Streptomyces]|uniref:acyl-CoA dehydrogenase family protein n=1 Tax=unclassified Streptomyces TaxID=2593676 RepID=UPI0004BDCA86|nr:MULTISPECIES: acyl-CoA dehydrogenase family protein [unclassified Streptomyces]
MEFGWTPEQRADYDRSLEAARSAAPRDPGAAAHYTREQWLRIGGAGLLGASVPAEYGGLGRGALDTALIYEAFGKGCARTGLVFASAAHLFACAMPLAEFGSDAVRKELLPGMCEGRLIAANAMTEPEAGSDISKLATTAVKVPGGYLLNGLKNFVTNGPVADLCVTYATTDATAGHLGTTAFVVDTETPGFSASEPFAKMGMHDCPAGTVEFRDCFVPDERVLGVPGLGGVIFQHSMGWERACLFALYLGVQERLIEEAVAHVRSRRQFGKRICDFQSVADRIVDMKLRLESGRLLLYRACWEMDRGDRAVLPVALSKLQVSEAAVASALDAIQLFGGRGYLAETGIESALRDAVPATVFSGSSEIQRRLIAGELGL